MRHEINPNLLTKKVRVVLVGAGGTGSQVLTKLAKMHFAMLGLGHPAGLHVIVCDDDTVTPANIGRQMFSPADQGHYKSVILVHRLNVFYGLDWQAAPCRINALNTNADLVIGCVDTRQGRRDIHEYCKHARTSYWLDCGNGQDDGQVILGEPLQNYEHKKSRPMRLPTVVEFFPDLLDTTIPESDDVPSCSLAEALEKQDLFINDMMATAGMKLLWNLFRHSGVEVHGYFINFRAAVPMASLAVDPDVWRQMIPRKLRAVKRKTEPAAETKAVAA